MPSVSVHLNVPRGHDLPEALLEGAARTTLAAEGIDRGELSVTFLPDDSIREMNRRWLGRDRPTDVLAFALHDPSDPPLGDVYVGMEQAERQAQELGAPFDEELARLVIHGTLHVLGYNHPEGESRGSSDFYRRQEALLDTLFSSRNAPSTRLDEEG